MVAISLYRGNLHRIPDVPRRWPMTPLRISLKDFKTLLNRRNRVLSRLRCRCPAISLNTNSNSKQETEAVKPNGSSLQIQLEENIGLNFPEEEGNVENEEIMDQGKLEGVDCLEKPVDDAEVAAKKADGYGKLQSVEPAEPSTNPNVQTSVKVGVLDGNEKRKKEVEEKLETLNAKKHNLVQALKQISFVFILVLEWRFWIIFMELIVGSWQILNAEEELKRRNCTQGMVTRPSGQLQVDVTTDSGLMARQTTPKTGSEANLGGDTEGQKQKML